MNYFILIILIMVISGIVGWRFKKKFKKFSKTPLDTGLSGKEVAEKMLQESNIEGVTVKEGRGMLTDHYNPVNRTITLSPDVYRGRNVASAAVAAHECGHAVQHTVNYSFLQFRSAMVPVVSASNRFVPWLLIGGILLLEAFPALLLAGIILFAASTLFSFITLPVEFDASKRALVWLDNSNITGPKEHDMAKKALNAAAMTYVMAAISALITLLFYLSIFMGRD